MYQDEYINLISSDNEVIEFLRPFSIGADFIKGDKRYCLWLVNVSEEDIQSHPDKMPLDLLVAHKANDSAVEAAYGVDFNGDEEKMVAHLFKLYAEKAKE